MILPPPFEKFSRKYKKGQWVNALVRIKGFSETSKKFSGLSVLIDGVYCRPKVKFISSELSDRLITCPEGVRLEVKITKIDAIEKLVTVEVLDKYEWLKQVKKLKNGVEYLTKVEKKLEYGYLLKMESGITGLLHNARIKHNATFSESDQIKVRVLEVDFDNESVYFKYK